MDFIEQYFVDPIKYGTGYNIYNTLTYGIIFVIFAYLIYKLLMKLKIEINNQFLVGLIPYIILGGILRVWEDAKIAQTVWLITPLIYFLVLGIALSGLIISIGIEKKIKSKYWKTWSIIGFALVILSLIPISKISNWLGIGEIVLITAGWVTLFLIIKKIAIIKKLNAISTFLNKENLLLILTHAFDATTTFVALQSNYFEQHVLGGLFVDFFGPAGMYVLKLPVVIVVLFVLDKELKKDRNLRNLIKIAILLLGLAPGIRNMLRFGLGV